MSDRVGQQLGNYRLTRLIGHGGFASVYLGEHIYLNTLAAIKVLDTNLIDDEIEQFCQEARLIAQLEHPHIIRVLDFGVEHGLPFLIMSYAPYGTLRQRHPKGAQVSPSLLVSYVKQIASALQYAHDTKLIHRDIKPENMLLSRNHELLLSDFGLAIVAQSSSKSSIKDISGTVVYMAPEQARGKPHRASDQYALAVIVYEWLCGSRPFHGTYEEVIVQHAFNPPPSLHTKNPKIPFEVEEVILRALAKDPHQRFPRIIDFAEALAQAYSIHAETTTIYPTTYPDMPPSSFPPLELSPAQSRSQTTSIYAISWSPDRRRIAFGGKERTIQIRGATDTTSSLVYNGHHGSVTTIAWSPDGQLIASASIDRTIQIWHTQNGERVATYAQHTGMVSALAWSPDGRLLASTSSGTDNAIHIWHAQTGTRHLSYTGHSHWVRTLAWSHNGQTIASGSWHEIHIWNTSTGQRHLTYKGHQSWLRSINWSPKGTRIASTGEDNTVQIWEPFNKGHLSATYRKHMDHVHTVLWSPDGRWLVSGGKDNIVHIWDAESMQQAATHHVRCTSTYALTWLIDSKHVVSANDNGTVQVWSVGKTSSCTNK